MKPVLFVLLISFSISSVALAGVQEQPREPFVEALVCNGHVMARFFDGTEEVFPNIFPAGGETGRWIALLVPTVGITSTFALFYFKGAYGAAAGLGAYTIAGLLGAVFYDFPAELGYESLESYENWIPHCRQIQRPVAPEKIEAVRNYIAGKKRRAGFNIFKSNCIDFAQELFRAAGRDEIILQVAHSIKPIQWSDQRESFWMRFLMATQKAHGAGQPELK